MKKDSAAPFSHIPIVVLAGGFGTRLRDTIGDIPKPMAPVNDRPFLYYLIMSYYQQGLRQFILSLYHLADKVVDYVRTESWPKDLDIKYFIEPRPLGTGGALSYINEQMDLGHEFFVCNGDTYLNSGISTLWQTYLNLARPCFALGLIHTKDASRFGLVETNSKGQIIAFKEKSAESIDGKINAGLYLLSTKILPNLTTPFSLEHNLFPKLLEQRILYGVSIDTDFIDIGVPSDYQKFCQTVENNRLTF